MIALNHRHARAQNQISENNWISLALPGSEPAETVARGQVPAGEVGAMQNSSPERMDADLNWPLNAAGVHLEPAE